MMKKCLLIAAIMLGSRMMVPAVANAASNLDPQYTAYYAYVYASAVQKNAETSYQESLRITTRRVRRGWTWFGRRRVQTVTTVTETYENAQTARDYAAYSSYYAYIAWLYAKQGDYDTAAIVSYYTYYYAWYAYYYLYDVYNNGPIDSRPAAGKTFSQTPYVLYYSSSLYGGQ